MNNIAIINMIDISEYFNEDIGGETSLSRVLEYTSKLPKVSEVVFLGSQDVEGYRTIKSDNWCEEVFIEKMLEVTKGYSNIFYFFADTPMLDSRITDIMYSDHIKHYAEYTFADGYPYGITPEILDREILPALLTLSKGSLKSISRSTIFDIVKKDINSFELETIIAKVDLRLLRVSLTVDNRRNTNQVKRIIECGGTDYESISNVLINKSEILFQEPSYITIELNKEKAQDTSYLPVRDVQDSYMKLDTLKTIMSRIKDYSDDFTVSFIPEYEPLKHPQIDRVIELITREYNTPLYMEVSGLLWSDKLFTLFKTNKNFHVIATLDALDREIYKSLRGEGYAEAYANAKRLIEIAKDRVWIQATRMKDNEIDMEPFYRYWQEFTDQIIIQKYSDYNKRLENRKVADLSPLKRFPCWHLKRDLHISTEGDVKLCFNDITGSKLLGSLVDDDINDIMAKKKAHYIDHINNRYCELCRNCDEYYTFNF